MSLYIGLTIIWKLWMVESIQSEYNSPCSWLDNISQYLQQILGFKISKSASFQVPLLCSVLKLKCKLRQQNLYFADYFKVSDKTVIGFAFHIISWVISPCVCYLPQLSALADNLDLCIDNPWNHVKPYPIISYWC